MYKFSSKSREKLNTCHPDLQKVMNEVIKHVDCTILEGVRTKERQEELVRTGKSKTMNSRHLPNKDGVSEALDVISYPIQWENNNRNYLFAGFVKGVAAAMGIELRLGADWNGNFDTTDQTFHDIVHIELKERK